MPSFGSVLALGLALVASLRPTNRVPSCFSYGPDTVRVTGTLARQMFYGAPGFGEDPKRDEKEIGLYLHLAMPACTVAGRDDEAKRNVRLVQLVLDSAGYARLRSFIGKHVTLRGTLFAAITGHHHAPILLDVAKPVRVER